MKRRSLVVVVVVVVVVIVVVVVVVSLIFMFSPVSTLLASCIRVFSVVSHPILLF
jgi:hypothetical protein